MPQNSSELVCLKRYTIKFVWLPINVALLVQRFAYGQHQSLYVVLVSNGCVCRLSGWRRGLVFKLTGMRWCDRCATHDVVFRLLWAHEGVELNEIISSKTETHDESQNEHDLRRWDVSCGLLRHDGIFGLKVGAWAFVFIAQSGESIRSFAL